MAIPTAVNGQITDAVTQANVHVLADAPAMAMGNLFQATAHALSLSAQNAVANQQSMNTLNSSALAASLNSLIGDGIKQ